MTTTILTSIPHQPEIQTVPASASVQYIAHRPGSSTLAREGFLHQMSYRPQTKLPRRWLSCGVGLLALLFSVQGWATAWCDVHVINGGTRDYQEVGCNIIVSGFGCQSFWYSYAQTSQQFPLQPGQVHTFLSVTLCGMPNEIVAIRYCNGTDWVQTPAQRAISGGSLTFTIYPGGKGIVDGNDRPPECEGSDCTTCGMPVWRVSQPYINLWLEDEPLGYQPALGPRLSLTLSYNQRDDNPGSDGTLSSFGNKWNAS